MEVEQQHPQETHKQPEQATWPSSFEEIFQNMGEGTPVETAEQAQAPQEGQPSQAVDTPQIQQPVSNDERRYQYWQSEADKRQNMIDSQQKQIEMMQQQIQQPAQPQAPVQQEEEKFPEPPRKPAPPAGFSREDAMADPSGLSAQYLNQVDQWRDDVYYYESDWFEKLPDCIRDGLTIHIDEHYMDEYNYLHSQYTAAKTNERIETMEKERQRVLKQQAAEQQWQQQQTQAVQHVQGQYGATPEQAQEFVQRYSDPKSVTMDNLWRLYQLEVGQGQVPNNGPSPAFQQTQNAQQVPSPMGVVSGSGEGQQGSIEDQMMQAMINDHNSTNYF